MEEKHSQLGDFGGIPGAPSGPPVSAKNPNPPFEVHEVARIFPPMSDPEFNDLKSDIAKNGLREPLWMYQGKVIDGRNRLSACTELGITPATREWNGEGTLLDFVVSLNLHRRHLNETQRAMVAARLKPSFEKAAKERSLAGKDLDPCGKFATGSVSRTGGKIAQHFTAKCPARIAGHFERLPRTNRAGRSQRAPGLEGGDAGGAPALQSARHTQRRYSLRAPDRPRA
jgi:hypothetical protein